MSPLAQHLSQLISKTPGPAAATMTTAGEGLYRMVVPAKVAAQFGERLLQPMKSTAAANGIYSALRDASGIVSQATFVPGGDARARLGGIRHQHGARGSRPAPARWNDALAKMADNKPVELDTLTRTFPGIDERGGSFRAHLQLAALAIVLKRRVIILQAVGHAQKDSGNPFENFVRSLKADQQRIDQLESGIASVLVRVSALELTRSHRLKDLVITPGDVDRLLRASHVSTNSATGSRSATA